jgi:hypothetical protein
MPKPKIKAQVYKQPAVVVAASNPQIAELMALPKQRVHFFSTSSSSEGGYDQGIQALIKDGKTIVCMQLTREHLIVVTE